MLKMKRCLVVGAGGCGREVLSWALHVKQSEWEIAGFLDGDPGALDEKEFPYKVLGDPATWVPSEDEVFIPALGDPQARIRVCSALQNRGAKFLSIIHPSVIMALKVQIGDGCVIAPNVVISANARLERFVFVNIGASIGHDSVTGEGTTVSCHCDVMGGVSIGRECFLGSHACVLPGKRVGDNSIGGAASAVVRNVAAGTTVMGVPAAMLFKAG